MAQLKGKGGWKIGPIFERNLSFAEYFLKGKTQINRFNLNICNETDFSISKINLSLR